ncbi:hypothetical protein ACTWJ9_01925 [Streptomyces sp. GDS52]|uniref:hypothetical protein n=1 Tax=unclassified Streptomyces TaxID=2593676 RepID=UPI0036689F1B
MLGITASTCATMLPAPAGALASPYRQVKIEGSPVQRVVEGAHDPSRDASADADERYLVFASAGSGPGGDVYVRKTR